MLNIYIENNDNSGLQFKLDTKVKLFQITCTCFMTLSGSVNEIYTYASLYSHHDSASIAHFFSERSHVLQTCIASIGQ